MPIGGATAKALIQPVWPSSVRSVWLLSRSHTRSVCDASPTRGAPVGRDRQVLTVFAWPSSDASFVRSRGPTPATFGHPSRTWRRLSGVTATALTERHDGLRRVQRLSALQVLDQRSASSPTQLGANWHRHGTDRVPAFEREQ